MNIAGLTSTKAVVSWSSGTNSFVQVANVSGTVVTAGASSYVTAAITSAVSVTRVADDKIIASYVEGGSAKVKIGSVSGDVITYGSAATIGSASTILGSTIYGVNAIVSYIEATSFPQNYKASYITISGTTATVANTWMIAREYGGGYSNIPNNLASVDGCLVTAVQIEQSGTPNLGLIMAFKPALNEVYMGVAKAGPTANVVTIINSGRTGGIFSGLTFGSRYLFNQDATISTSGVFPAGTAISTTELLLD
jgi:hypothetical protein